MTEHTETDMTKLTGKEIPLPIIFLRPAVAAETVVAPPPLAGITCPLCRRRNTVTLLAHQMPEAARGKHTYKCSYSGCRGVEFEL